MTFTFDDLFKPASVHVECSDACYDASKPASLHVPTPHRVVALESQLTTPDRVIFHFDIKAAYQVIIVGGNVKKARETYMAGAGKWLVGLVDQSSIAILVPQHASNQMELDDWLISQGTQVFKTEHISKEILDVILQYSVVFELNRSHRWISIGPNVFTMSVDDVVTTPNQSGHKNVAVITVDCNPAVNIHMQVRRYYPVDAAEMTKSKASSFNVYVLPTLCEGLCLNPIEAKRDPPAFLRSPQALADYWRDAHGYKIPIPGCASTLNVIHGASGAELTYPEPCVWRNRWSFLPNHTKQFLPVIRERVMRELDVIRQLWSWQYIETRERQPIPLDSICMREPNVGRKRPTKKSRK